MEAKPEYAIIDFHYLSKNFEECTQYKLVIPAYFISDLKKRQESKDDEEHFLKYQTIIEYLEENAILLNPPRLPKLPIQIKKEFRSLTYIFVRYVFFARNLYPKILVISDSRETKALLKKLNVQFTKK